MRSSAAALLAVLSLSGAVASAEVVQVQGPRVRLSDLLGSVAEDRDLGPAPLPGCRRRIARRQVLSLLGEARAGRLPDGWVVETRQQRLGCAELTTELKKALSEQLTDGIELKALDCPRAMTLPVGELKVSAKLLGGGRRAGRLPVAIELSVGEWSARRLTLTANVDGLIDTLVTTQAVTTASGVSAAQVKVEQRLASALPADALTKAEELEGHEVVGMVPAGSVLRRVHLKAIPLVRQGSSVTIAVILEGVQITSRGVARQDGKRNDVVSVLALASNRLIKARVLGPHLVAVDL
ncbi:MAG: flagellar basal body P-ring formation protein FlgA [Deltaproteobacteria bacterium]|nr:flagellar basal body P-ring formation protein FlgA [Deltaproteobacteria bacterium]